MRPSARDFPIPEETEGCAKTLLYLVESESQDFIFLKCPPAEETRPEEPERRVSLVEEQLRHTQEKLCIKESEVDSQRC